MKILIVILLVCFVTAVPSLAKNKRNSHKNQKIFDNIDLPFVNDSEVIGKWKSVDFVRTMDQFVSSQKFWKSSLYLKELKFKKKGKMSVRWLTWTKGVVMHKGDTTASKYLIKKIDGGTYMFYEWKSGDYTIRGMKPCYYVLKKK